MDVIERYICKARFTVEENVPIQRMRDEGVQVRVSYIINVYGYLGLRGGSGLRDRGFRLTRVCVCMCIDGYRWIDGCNRKIHM